jgi:hypothetical protein
MNSWARPASSRRSATRAASTPPIGPGARSGCWTRRPTPSCAPRAWGAICAAGRACTTTSRSPTTRSRRCWRRPRARSSPRCPASRLFAPPRSRPTRCPSSAGHGRAPVFGAGDLPVLDDHPPRAHQPPRPARAPRRAHEHRLGTQPTQRRLPRPRRRTPRPRLRPNPGARRARPPRLPPVLAPASDPTALRRSALRSRTAARAVTALTAMPHDGATQLAARPRSRSSRRTRKPAARRRLISPPTQAAASAHLADSPKYRDPRSRR